MKLEDIKKLAEMARIDMPEADMEAMAHDFDPILAYVGQVSELSDNIDTKEDYLLTNIMREDKSSNQTGEFIDRLIEQMPASADGFLKVKQIL